MAEQQSFEQISRRINERLQAASSILAKLDKQSIAASPNTTASSSSIDFPTDLSVLTRGWELAVGLIDQEDGDSNDGKDDEKNEDDDGTFMFTSEGAEKARRELEEKGEQQRKNKEGKGKGKEGKGKGKGKVRFDTSTPKEEDGDEDEKPSHSESIAGLSLDDIALAFDLERQLGFPAGNGKKASDQLQHTLNRLEAAAKTLEGADDDSS